MLTVKKLIEMLQQLPPNAPVVNRDEDGYYRELGAPYKVKADEWQGKGLKNRTVVIVE